MNNYHKMTRSYLYEGVANEIENMKFDEIQKYLSTKTKLHALEIPYMIIFSNLPKNLSNFTVSLADVD